MYNVYIWISVVTSENHRIFVLSKAAKIKSKVDNARLSSTHIQRYEHMFWTELCSEVTAYRCLFFTFEHLRPSWGCCWVLMSGDWFIPEIHLLLTINSWSPSRQEKWNPAAVQVVVMLHIKTRYELGHTADHLALQTHLWNQSFDGYSRLWKTVWMDFIKTPTEKKEKNQWGMLLWCYSLETRTVCVEAPIF